MVSPNISSNTCPNCGDEFPPETLVCPKCKNILAGSAGKKKTPVWVIALLTAVIVALIIYIVYLINTVVMQHNF